MTDTAKKVTDAEGRAAFGLLSMGEYRVNLKDAVLGMESHASALVYGIAEEQVTHYSTHEIEVAPLKDLFLPGKKLPVE